MKNIGEALYGLIKVILPFKGLRNYGYNDEADELTVKMFHNLEGLLNDVPINENYSPITGKPLNALGFSWSFLCLY